MTDAENPLKDALLFEPELYARTLDRESRGWKWAQSNGVFYMYAEVCNDDGFMDVRYESIPEMRKQLDKENRALRRAHAWSKEALRELKAFKQWLKENPV